MPSRYGVYYDLGETPYLYELEGYTFAFSSRQHRDSFHRKLHDAITSTERSLHGRFHVDIECGFLAALQLYRRVETRGFLVVNPSGQALESSDAFCFYVVVNDYGTVHADSLDQITGETTSGSGDGV